VFQWLRLPLTGCRLDIRLVSYSGRTPTFCVFPVFSGSVMEKCCDACGVGEYYFRSGFWALQSAVVQRYRLLLTRSRRDTRSVSYSGKTPTFCLFPVLGATVMAKCCDACGVGNTISGREFRRCRVAVSQRHRLPLTGSRWDIRWVSCMGKTPTFCLVPVFRKHIVVMEKCCDACGVGEYYFRSGFRRYRVTVFQRLRLPLIRCRRDIRSVSYSGNTPTFCVFPAFGVPVMEKCCDACGDGEYYFQSCFPA
jgi:hypothetical protein